MADALTRIATCMAPLAKEHGFTRKGRYFRKEDKSRTVAFLAVRRAPVSDRAITAFRVFGSISTAEWTAWSRGGDGDPSLVRGPGDGIEMWPLVPPFGFWYEEVADRLVDYPRGRRSPRDSRQGGAWACGRDDQVLQECADAVAGELERQAYIADLVRLMDRDHLRNVVAVNDGIDSLLLGRALHFMLEASARPDAVEEVLASATPRLPASMEAFIRTSRVLLG